MIKLNYELCRNEKDENKKYFPKDYPTEFNNLVYLKGPNGTGKSAILHIIAIALYGNHLSNDEIDPGIRRRLDNLLDPNQNELTFELEITNQAKNLHLISRKKDKYKKDIDVVLISDGKEIPYPKEKFFREFRLLYTIPNNPTEQLPQLLSEIKVSQTELGSRIMQFRNYFEARIRTLEKSRDEETLDNAKKEKDKISFRKQEIEDELWNLREEHKKFERYFYLNTYLECNSEITGLHNQLSTLEGELKELEKKVIRRSKEVLKSGRKLDQIMRSIENEKNSTMPILAKYCFFDLKKRYSIINSSSVLTEIKKPELQKTIRENLAVFIDTIESLAKSEETANARDLDSLELYSSLISLLRNPRYQSLNIPGTIGDVNILLGHIQDAIADIKVIQDKIEGYHSDIVKIRGFTKNVNEAITLYKNNKSQDFICEPSNEEIRLDELEQKKSLLEQKVRTINLKRGNARKKMLELGLDPSFAVSLETQYKSDQQIQNFSAFSESQQAEKIELLDQNIKNLEFQSNQLKLMLQSQTKKIDELERQEVDPDRVYLPQLRLVNRKLVPLESLFRSTLSSSLMRIDNKQIENGLDQEYSQIIGAYYAKKMQKVLYVDQEYEVENVDIVNRVIKTTSGKHISFDDLSTGQSQSSYLTTRLAMTDSKMTFALFDEVAMMDSKSLSPVISLLKSNYQQGKLLGSIIVQKAETTSVEEL